MNEVIEREVSAFLEREGGADAIEATGPSPARRRDPKSVTRRRGSPRWLKPWEHAPGRAIE